MIPLIFINKSFQTGMNNIMDKPASAKIKVAMADHNRLFRKGVVQLLQAFDFIDIVQDVETGKDLVELSQKEKFDIILVNCSLSDMSGAEATQQIKAHDPDAKVLCLSDKADIDCVSKMVEAGVTGYVMKNTSIQELANSIMVVYHGNVYFSSEVDIKKLATVNKKARGVSHRISDLSLPITDREFEILKFIAEELTNKEIADALFISPRTVDTHRRNLLQKLNVKNTAGLVKYYLSVIEVNG